MNLKIFGLLVVLVLLIDKMFVSPTIMELGHEWFAGNETIVMLFILVFTMLFPTTMIILLGKALSKKS